jgi:hypothetical protein
LVGNIVQFSPFCFESCIVIPLLGVFDESFKIVTVNIGIKRTRNNPKNRVEQCKGLRKGLRLKKMFWNIFHWRKFVSSMDL